MIRRILACLAFLSGLVATGMPAQAEVAAALSSRVEANAVAIAAPAATRAVRSVAVRPAALPIASLAQMSRDAVGLPPRVCPRGDRALE
jgi:hypothetical protein